MHKSESDEPMISADVAELIATGIVARGGLNLKLFRTEVEMRDEAFGMWSLFLKNDIDISMFDARSSK
jgi:hypothetical protein